MSFFINHFVYFSHCSLTRKTPLSISEWWSKPFFVNSFCISCLSTPYWFTEWWPAPQMILNTWLSRGSLDWTLPRLRSSYVYSSLSVVTRRAVFTPWPCKSICVFTVAGWLSALKVCSHTLDVTNSIYFSSCSIYLVRLFWLFIDCFQSPLFFISSNTLLRFFLTLSRSIYYSLFPSSNSFFVRRSP